MRNGRTHWTARVAVGATLASATFFSAGAWRMHVSAKISPQIQTPAGKTMPQSPLDETIPATPGENGKLEGQRDRMWNDERRKKLISDTDKLLQLATELKVDVDKSTRNELSIKVIQKATEIEKLSHDVKERMRN